MGVYQSFAVTVQGGSHIKEGKICQDSSGNYDEAGLSIAAAADGHGDNNCFRSDAGARVAVNCAEQMIREFVDYHKKRFPPEDARSFENTAPLSHGEFEKMIGDLKKRIVMAWQEAVEQHYTANPFTAGELAQCDEKHRKRYEAGKSLNKAYGATLLAAVVTPHYWFGLHIGDGRFTVLYPDGTFDQPVPWDEKCYLNITTSICDDDGYERSRSYFAFAGEKAFPAAVFLCSDGIDDNYPVDENEKHLYKLYRIIALTFAEDGFESTCAQLKDLVVSFATKGKGDDTTIAGFVDMAALNQAVTAWREQIAKEETAIL